MKEIVISLFSGIIGVILTICYQHFFNPPQSFTFIYNGEEMVVTESAYTELVKTNENLQKELLNTQEELKKLEEQINDSQGNTNVELYNTPLTSLEYFSRTGNVQINYSVDCKDNYDTVYPYCITPFDSGEAFI